MREGFSYFRLMGVVVVLASAPAVAMAYIDPGSGAYMVQALFTLVGAALFYLRHPIRSAKTFIKWLISRRKAGVIGQFEEARSGRIDDEPGADVEKTHIEQT